MPVFLYFSGVCAAFIMVIWGKNNDNSLHYICIYSDRIHTCADLVYAEWVYVLAWLVPVIDILLVIRAKQKELIKIQ